MPIYSRITLYAISGLLAFGLSGLFLSADLLPFNQVRIVELLLLACLTLTCIITLPGISASTAPPSINSKEQKTILIVGLLAVTAAIRSTYIWPAMQDLAHDYLLICSIFVMSFYVSLDTPRTVKILIFGLAIGISIALARFLIQLGLTLSMGVVTPLLEWWSPYSNPRFIAQALIWIIPTFSVLPSLENFYSKRALYAAQALSISLWLLLFWTGSRGEILGLILGMILVCTLMRSSAISLIGRMMAHALCGFAIWFLSHISIARYAVSNDELSLARVGMSGREWLVELSLKLISEHPWFGIGSAQFSAYNQNIIGSAHPHNLLLQIAVEWGLPAAVLLLHLLAMFVLRQYRSAKIAVLSFDTASTQHHTLKIPLLLTLFAVLFTSLIDGIHVMPLSQLIGIPMLGLMIGLNRGPNIIPTESYIFQGRLIVLLIILCWGILLASLLQQRDCLTYPTRAEKILKAVVGNDFPRFWAQGRIPIDEGCLEAGRYQNHADTLTHRSVDASTTTEQYWR